MNFESAISIRKHRYIRWLGKEYGAVPIIVWLCIAIHVAAILFLSAYKYHYILYDSFDLGIFNQVFWNISHGRWFEYSFNDYSYLVDHREWIILLLAPLYALVPHPLTLITVQELAIAFGAVPLYRIATHVFSGSPCAKRYGMIAVFFYLIHPTVQAMGLFEFHVLTFAMPLAFWMWYAVLQKKWPLVYVVWLLLLLVREDVPLMTAGIGLLLLVTQKERESRDWARGSVLVLGSVAWFLAMAWLGAVLSPEGSAKFYVYYQWLGATPLDGLLYAVTHPLHMLAVFFGYDHSVVLIFLFISVGLLPLVRMRYLLPAALPLVLFLLINQPTLAVLLKAHYLAIVIPWFFIAALYGRRRLKESGRLQKITWFSPADRRIIIGGFVAIVVCEAILLNPVWEIIYDRYTMRFRDLDSYRTLVASIPADDSVMVSTRMYAYFSEREHEYPLTHLLRGKQHYSQLPYVAPQEVDWVVMEHESILHYSYVVPFEFRRDAWKRLEDVIRQNGLVLAQATEDFLVYGRYSLDDVPGALVETPAPTMARTTHDEVAGDIVLTGWEYGENEFRASFEKLPQETLNEVDRHMQLSWFDASGNKLKEKVFPLGYGTAPTHEWKPGAENSTAVTIPITEPAGTDAVFVSIGTLSMVEGQAQHGFHPVTLFEPELVVPIMAEGREK